MAYSKGNNLFEKFQQLLISYIKPSDPVSKDTISRWCKGVLGAAGVDVSKFKGHSTIAASTSHLAECDFKIQDIMSSAGCEMKLFFNVSTTKQFWIQLNVTCVNLLHFVIIHL